MRPVLKGSTDQSVVIRIIDSTAGTPETAVEHNTSGIDLWYRREGATKTSITEAALAALDSAHSDGGIEHIGDGYYRLDLPDAAFATGANGVMVGGTVTDMIVIGCYVPLVGYDPYDAVRMGLTALPNAAAAASGGLFIRGTGAGAINQNANGQVDVNVVNAAGTAWGSGAITAASIASNAIANAKIADGAITAAKIASDAITAVKIATGAITNAKFAAGAIDAASIATDAITAAKIAADAIGSSELAQAAADKVWATTARTITAATNITSTGGTTVPQTGDSFARIGATGSGLTSTAQASVCTETRLSELDAGTAGKAANQIDIIQTDTTTDIPALIDALPTAAENRAEMDSNSTQLAAIVADTNELQTDLTNGGRLDLIADAILADTNELQSDNIPGTLSTIGGKIDDILTDTGTTLDGKVDAIKAKTDSLTFTEAGIVDANVENVNDIAIGGAGTSGDPWGPAA